MVGADRRVKTMSRGVSSNCIDDDMLWQSEANLLYKRNNNSVYTYTMSTRA